MMRELQSLAKLFTVAVMCNKTLKPGNINRPISMIITEKKKVFGCNYISFLVKERFKRSRMVGKNRKTKAKEISHISARSPRNGEKIVTNLLRWFF